MTKDELIKIFSAYLPYRLEFKLPLASDRYDDITKGSWWRVAHTLETAIEAKQDEIGVKIDLSKSLIFEIL